MRNLSLLAIAMLVLGSSISASADQRTWTDATGKHKVEAEFVGLEDGQVRLRKSSGEVVSVPMARLSDQDRRWVIRNRRSLGSARTSPGGPATSTPGDWPRWRGPGADAVSPESGLLRQWDDGGPPVLWSSRGLGRGYSSISIFDGKIFTMGKKGGTKLICVSADDGSPIWEVDVSSGGGNPNCTPTVDPDAKLIYALSHDGKLVCADINGRKIWSTDFQSDFGGAMMSGWGYSESPLVDGDRLICTPGSDQAVMAAINKRTGQMVWKTSMPDGKAGYASPVISNGGGVKQYVTLVGKGLIGVRASDGQLLWNYSRIANSTANIPTPIVSDDFVFGSSGYGDGGSALLRLVPAGRGGQVRVEEVYYKRNNEVQNHHGGMVLIGDHIYMGHGHNNGLPLCLEMKTGRVVWGPQRGAGTGSAAVLAAEGNLYFRYENAVMALIEATPRGYNLKGSFKIKSRNDKSWPHPVIVGKKLYLRDQDELHCYDIAG